MGKQDVIEIDGIVEDTLPNAMFKVKLANGHTILAHVSGIKSVCITFAFYREIGLPLKFHRMI